MARQYELNYVAGPVAQRFHDDITSEVKLLVGPYGTGKIFIGGDALSGSGTTSGN